MLATAAAIFLTTGAGAFEPTGSPVADAVLHGLELGGTVATYGSATGDDTSATFKDLVLSLPGLQLPEAYRFGEIVVAGASVDGDRFSAESLTATNVVMSLGTPGVSVTIERIVGTDFVRTDPNAEMFTGHFRAENLGLTGLNVPFSLGSFDYDLTADATGRAFQAALNWTGVTVHGSELPPEMATLLTALGYDEMTLSVTADLGIDTDSGVVDYRRIVYSLKNAADISLRLRIGGLTPDRLVRLRQHYLDLLKAHGALPAPPTPVDGKMPEISPEDQEKAATAQAALAASFEQLKEDAGDVTFQSFGLTIDNKSIVQRLLSLQATQAGTTPDVLTQQLIAGVPQMSAAIPDPAFRQQASEAAVAFLKSPGSITLSLDPAEPVPLRLFLGDTPPDPATLATLLGATITATPAP